jgi:hypothetical protein
MLKCDKYMKMRKVYPLLLTLILILACSNGKKEQAREENQAPAVANEAITYEMKIVEKKDSECSVGESDCTYVKFQYPEIIKAPNETAKQVINGKIKEFLHQPIFEEEKFYSFQEIMNDFISAYQKFIKEFPSSPQSWSVERTISVVYQSPKVLSFESKDDQYTGGAHPNAVRTFLNLNTASGKPIKLSDILVPDCGAQLNTIAEKKFRELKGLKPNESLSDAGFDFKDNKFSLNDNFLIGKFGITFYYNSYEIAPYAVGPTELVLDYSEIKDLIRTDGPLSSM